MPANPAVTDHTPPSASKVYLFLVLTTLFWGGSFLFTKIGVSIIPPIHFVAIRFSIATAIMLIVSAGRLKLLESGCALRGVAVGIALGMTNIVFVFGISGTTISRAGILNNLFVLFIPLLSKLFWKERIGVANMAGIALAVLGIILLASGGGGFNSGDLISTICAFCIALHILSVSKIIRRGDDIYLISLFQFLTVAVISSVALLLTGSPAYQLTPASAASVVYCAIFPTVICFTLQNAFQRYTTPTRAGLIYTLDPVWSLIAGFLFLGERLGMLEWLGCALLFAAVILPLLIQLFEDCSAS